MSVSIVLWYRWNWAVEDCFHPSALGVWRVRGLRLLDVDSSAFDVRAPGRHPKRIGSEMHLKLTRPTIVAPARIMPACHRLSAFAQLARQDRRKVEEAAYSGH